MIFWLLQAWKIAAEVRTEDVLLEPPPGAADKYAASVATAGNLVYVGSPEMLNPTGLSAVYVYRNFELVYTIQPQGGDALEAFGVWVEASENMVVVSSRVTNGGSLLDDDNVVYVFRTLDDGDTYDQLHRVRGGPEFGIAGAIKGDLLVLGIFRFQGLNTGTAKIYRVNASQFTELDEVIGNKPKPAGGFGRAIAIDGDFLAIAAPDDGGINGRGIVYLFQRQLNDTWQRTANLQQGDGGGEDEGFGESVAMQDRLIVVGAPRDDDVRDNSGAVWVFRRPVSGNGVERVGTVKASVPEQDAFFGWSVALFGPLLVASAWGIDFGFAQNVGALYAFETLDEGDNFTQVAQLVPAEFTGRSWLLGLPKIGISDQGFVIAGAQDNNIFASRGTRAYAYFTDTLTSQTPAPTFATQSPI